jgi:copper resistance protein C
MKRFAVVAALALAFPATAAAHATLEHTVPTEQGRVAHAPRVARLNFDQSVTPLPNSILVYTARGRVVSRPARSDNAGHDVVAVLDKRLPAGAYTVRWHVVSGDGHVISGVFTFGVRVAAPPPTQAYGASARRRPSTSSAGRTSSHSRCCSGASAAGCWSSGLRCRRALRSGSTS